jgi:uncharacterized protein (DUF1697 family)
MPRHIAFLRAINVGGHVVRMEALRTHFTSLGFTEVSTFIASGNVLFHSRGAATREMERKIEARLKRELGYEVATFVRTREEVAAISAYRPFPEAEIGRAGAFCVGFLAKPLEASGHAAIQAFTTEIDQFHLAGRELYWLCRTRQSDSTFSNVRLEKAIGVKATFRSMTTIARLAAL